MSWNSSGGGSLDDFHAFKSTSSGSSGSSGCLVASTFDIIASVVLILWIFSKCSN